MNILIVSTSPRKGSLTLRFSNYLSGEIKKQLPAADCRLIDFAGFDISPLGKGSFPSETASPFQQDLLLSWEKAGLIIICSPEYNWTASAETFILLERLGNGQFRHFFDNKVFAAAGVSSGRGGRQPALDISRVVSKIIGFLGTSSIVSSKILEVHEAGSNLSEEAASCGNKAFEDSTAAFVRYTASIANRWFSSQHLS